MPLLELYHGSRHVVDNPLHGFGNPRNDYGLGFYCTRSHDLACEWACPDNVDGYANRYRLDSDGLAICDLESEPFGTLSWLAVLVRNRGFNETTPLMTKMKQALLGHYDVDLGAFDIVTGYRADDSYFSFARAFLDNRISLRQLEGAMRLGGLGQQVVLKSEKAFEALTFCEAESVRAETWHARRVRRDRAAREAFKAMTASYGFSEDDVFALDILRSVI